jgi:hypothetical protein
MPRQGVSRPKQACEGIMNNYARLSRYPAKRAVLLHRKQAHASPGDFATLQHRRDAKDSSAFIAPRRDLLEELYSLVV